MNKALLTLFLLFGTFCMKAQIPNPAVASEDLIAHWRLNFTGSDDAEGNFPLNLIYDNFTYNNQIERNGCLNMSTISEALNCGTINLDNRFTVSLWLYAEYLNAGLKTLFSNADGADAGLSATINPTTGEISFLSANTESGVYQNYTHLNIVLLVDKTAGVCNIYVNGVDVTASSSIPTNFSTNTEFYLGSLPDFTQKYSENLDDFRIYNRLLNEEEIITIYTGAPPGPPACELNPLEVSANQVINSVTGEEVILKGLCYDDQGFCWLNPDDGSPAEWHNRHQTVYEDFAAMAAWGANCVRMPVMSVWYDLYNIDPQLYVDLFLRPQVELAEYFGMYAIIDYHDYCQSETTEIVDFWEFIVQEFKDEDHVIYEILNEPAQTEDWGPAPCSGSGVGIGNDPWLVLKETAEAAIDIIRAEDADALVIVNGLLFGSDHRRMQTDPIERENIIYGAHPYPTKTACIPESRDCCPGEMEGIWESYFGFLTEYNLKYPVMLTEFGWNINHADDNGREWYASTEEYWVPLSKYLERKNMGYVAFSFVQLDLNKYNVGEDGGLSLYGADDGYYQPSEMGQAIKNDLNSFPGTDFCNAPDVPPYVSFAGIESDILIGNLLEGSYTYRDINGDPEGSSIYQWYQSDYADGTGAIAITGATSLTYLPTASDLDKYVAFEVTPVASGGASPGTPIRSQFYGPVVEPEPWPSEININFGNGYCNVNWGWYNIRGGDAREEYLRDGISIVLPHLQYGFSGEPVSAAPYEIGLWYNYIQNTTEEIIIKGLDPLKKYDIQILSSRDNAGIEGDVRNTSFAIGAEVQTINSVGNTDYLTFDDISPSPDQSVTINMSATGYGYINALVIIEKNPGTAQLLAHWPLDGDGTDISGNGNSISDFGGGCFADDAKKGSHSLFFFTNTHDFCLGEFDFTKSVTLTYWGRHRFEGVYPYMFGENTSTGDYLRVIYDLSEQFLEFQPTDGINYGDYRIHGIKNQVPDFSYHHYIYNFDLINERVKLYVDGIELGQCSIPNISLTNFKLWLGGGNNGSTCMLDDVRLYDGQLSPEQINALLYVDDIVAPDGLSATIDEEGTHLTWNDNSNNEENFQVLKYGPTGQPCHGGPMVTLPANTVAYTDEQITSNTPENVSDYVSYYVVAISENGHSERSSPLDVCKITTVTEGSGTVDSDKKMAIKNEVVTALAVPDPGNKFVEWTGDIHSTDNPIQILMDAPKSITAVFEEDDDEDVRRIQVSFGPASLPAPVGWNNMHDHWIGAQLNDLLDVNSESTGIDLRLIDGWTNSSSWGHYPGIYPDNVMKGYFYINNDTEQTINLYNLSTNKQYDITLFASRKEYNYTTNYIVDGNTQSLNVYNNTQDTVVFESVMPNELGVLTIGCQRASGSNYAYINAMIITERGPSTPQPPVAVEDSYSSIIQGSTLTIDALQGVLANDTDPEGVPLTAVLVRDVSYGTLSLNADGSFVYTHDGSGHLSDAFSYQAYDGMLYSNTVNVQLNLVTEGEEITIKVNFGYEPGWFLPPSDWNSIFGFPSYGNGITNLQNTEGESTGYNIMLQGTWSSFEYLGNYPGVYPDNVMTTNYAYYGDIDRIIQISNLDASSTYDINIFASRKANPAETSFDINGSGNRQSLATLDNTDSTVTFTGISPTVDNEILISCRKEYHAAHINGLILTEHPVVPKTSQQEVIGIANDILLYPNPVHDVLLIDNIPEKSFIRVYNIAGEKIDELQNHANKQMQIPMSSYQNGIYTVQIIDQDGRKLIPYRVIKQ